VKILVYAGGNVLGTFIALKEISAKKNRWMSEVEPIFAYAQ
jgi:hypothetical protein